MLCRMVPVARNKKGGSVPVYLNVYDLTPINGYAYWLGLGIYHSGVQGLFLIKYSECSKAQNIISDAFTVLLIVHGVEYGFGAHDYATTGIFEVEPRRCPGFTFRKSILIGRTDLGPREVRAFMEKLAEEYSGNTYHLITKNCNHFCNDVCLRLTRKPIPRWINRLARLGLFCNCVLPAGLNETKIRHVQSENRALDGEEKKLRSQSSRFPSSSTSGNMSSSRSLRSSGRNSRSRHCLPPSSSLIHSASATNLSLKI